VIFSFICLANFALFFPYWFSRLPVHSFCNATAGFCITLPGDWLAFCDLGCLVYDMGRMEL
jgi:hypothetical protein